MRVHRGNFMAGYMLHYESVNMPSASVTFSEPITSPNSVIWHPLNMYLASVLPLRSKDFMRSLSPLNRQRDCAFLPITMPLTSRLARTGTAASASD